MGIYLNPGNDAFFSTVNYSEIYVDKTMLIDFTNKCLFGENKEICVSRPRRFGKSIAENMLTAYYSKGCDSKKLFSKFKIAETADFEKHLNQYNVIHVDMQNFMKYSVVKEMIQRLTREILFDISVEFPDVKLFDENDLTRSLKDIFAQKKQKFIFIIDEWDCIFRIHKDNTSAQKEYLDFLRDLLKGQPYVTLAYMTGILPIKKYGEHSALNMFKEYSMTMMKPVSEFTGFTDEEVKTLCSQYDISFEEMKSWYNGYVVDGISVYNPNAVAEVVSRRQFSNYWSKTETYEALRFYIKMNFKGLKDAVKELIAGQKIPVNVLKFTNDMITFNSIDDILTLLIHLGYLTYDFDTKTAWIPNKEVRQEFVNSIEDGGFENIVTALKKSDKLLRYTLEQNAEKVSEMLSEVHNENTSVIQYNDENSLSCVLSLAYYSAQDTYAVYRELQGGEGFADLVFVPRAGNTNPAMIIELKWNKNAGIALNQIKNRQYIKSLKDYHGKVLFVGINYDKKSKKHECKFEMTEM